MGKVGKRVYSKEALTPAWAVANSVEEMLRLRFCGNVRRELKSRKQSINGALREMQEMYLYPMSSDSFQGLSRGVWRGPSSRYYVMWAAYLGVDPVELFKPLPKEIEQSGEGQDAA